MSKSWKSGSRALISFAAVVCVAGIALPRGVGADLEATAKTLVNQAAGVKAGDRVLISGTPRDIELLENIAINVQKLGAFPIITIESERLTKRSYDDVPANFDAQTNDFGLKLAGIANVTIGVDSTENEGLLANVPPARRAARAKANQAVMQAFLKNNVRQVSLGNGLFPTEATAKRYGLAQDELSKSFWDAVNVDYSKLQYTGDSVRSILAAGKEIQVTNPNGTDIKFRIESRPVLVSDGVISKDDVAKGGAACQVWLPAGEVYATPVPGTAEGKIVVDRHYFQGKEITGLTLTFKGGKLTEMTAKSGLEPLKALYDASAAGKDELGFFDIGINPALKATADTKLRTWVPAGMVSIGIGGNTWAGGTNDCPFDVPCFLPGSTLKVDGKALIENGTLKP